MRFELSLLENSHDYVINSFDLYRIADEDGIHDEQLTEFKNKVKWKLAFVTMVQAFELLMKEALFRIHPNLVYEDIDADKVSEKKTVSFQQAINRLSNLSNCPINDENKAFLVNCSKIRNEFVHYKVDIQSENLKSKYSMLYSIYKELHKLLIGEEIKFEVHNYRYIEQEILSFAKDGVVFRGREMTMAQLEDFKRDILENAQYKYYVSFLGEKKERIKFGDEANRVSQEYKDKHDITYYQAYDI